MIPLPLSVLDLTPVASGATAAQALRNTIELAQHAERLGYTRYWLAEHHNMPGVASSAPEILIGAVARETTRLRIGSGGIMLPNHAPLKVVEWFRLLEALYPGRIDLGIGRAPGTDGLTALALRRSRDAISGDDFPSHLAELLAFANDDFPESHPFHAITATPVGVPLPPVWLLGSSDFSAQVAAMLGVGFAFARHISPDGAPEALALYRERFTPAALPKPYAILGLSAICADTDERASELATSADLSFLRLRTGRPGLFPSVEEARDYPYTPQERAQVQAGRARHIIGSPATVEAQLRALLETTGGADEVMVTSMIHNHADRVRSYELLADIFGLAGSATPAEAATGVAGR